MLYTPSYITELEENQVFVFGSNEAGIHRAGAAKMALKFGAVLGCGFGFFGHTFAIPTKDRQLQTLPIRDIAAYVNCFGMYARRQPHLQFLVTEIGCGLAGYTPEEIAPLFYAFRNKANIVLPEKFIEIITD